MIKFIPPTDFEKINRQIQALEWQITHDKNDKDRELHQVALSTLKSKLEDYRLKGR